MMDLDVCGREHIIYLLIIDGRRPEVQSRRYAARSAANENKGNAAPRITIEKKEKKQKGTKESKEQGSQRTKGATGSKKNREKSNKEQREQQGK